MCWRPRLSASGAPCGAGDEWHPIENGNAPRCHTSSTVNLHSGEPMSHSVHHITQLYGMILRPHLIFRHCVLQSRVQLRHLSTLPTAIGLTPSGAPAPDVPLPRSLPPSRALLLLHIPLLPTSWPPRLELTSSLLSTTSTTLKSSKIAVNAIYDGTGSSTAFAEDEVYPARLLYPDGRVFSFPEFSTKTLGEKGLLEGLGYKPDEAGLPEPSGGRDKGDRQHEILVCTHGSRDCRCSDRGIPLIRAIREEIARRGVEGRVKVSEIAHVGGHK